jgi:hypothetical protein
MMSARAVAVLLLLGLALCGAVNAQTPQRNFVSGSGNATGTGATTIIAAPSITGYRLYVRSVQCGRTDAGTTASRVTLNDDGSTVLVLPNTGGGGSSNVVFPMPLTVPRTTALTFTSSASISTVYCSAQAFEDN